MSSENNKNRQKKIYYVTVLVCHLLSYIGIKFYTTFITFYSVRSGDVALSVFLSTECYYIAYFAPLSIIFIYYFIVSRLS